MSQSGIFNYIRLWGRRTPVTLGLHIALTIIIVGALVTHFFGIQGTVTLVKDADAPTYTYLNSESGEQGEFPFALRLTDCTVEYYPATSSPMDFVSKVMITDADSTFCGTVAMNRVLTYRHWRFYQTGMSGNSSTFTIAYDPWGIGITYTGYAMLALCMSAFFLQRKSLWRSLLRSRRGVRYVTVLMVAMFATFHAEAAPRTLQRPLAADFGRLWVYHNDRPEQMQTFAIDFTLKLCGSRTWQGLTPEQVMTGWLFYYDDWKREPMIKVSQPRLRRLLGIEGKYAALIDFFDSHGYKLEQPLRTALNDKELRKLDECVALISSVATGSAMLIYPCTLNDGRQEWLSWVDRRPTSLSAEQWEFIVTTHTRLFTSIARGQNIAADSIIHDIRRMQLSVISPSVTATAPAIRLLNRLVVYTLPAGIFAVVAAILLFIFNGNVAPTASRTKFLTVTGILCALIILLYVSSLLLLRGIIGGHWPLTDGYETLLTLALLASLTGLCLRRVDTLIQGAAMLIAGCSLICAHITTGNPTVTPLMPVLASPWLAIHVMLVMGAYALMAFMAVTGIAGAVTRTYSRAAELAKINYLLLLPAVFLLMCGIFTGAVWANQSWGRYWGWDPKETCALITLLYYAVPLHRTLLPSLRASGRDLRATRRFNAWIALGILVVLFTYFGANYLLPGLHSYA